LIGVRCPLATPSGSSPFFADFVLNTPNGRAVLIGYL
jgi:hypothetical protein